jgi:hypothetical protein
MWGYGLDRASLGLGQLAGTCECSNELSGSPTIILLLSAFTILSVNLKTALSVDKVLKPKHSCNRISLI